MADLKGMKVAVLATDGVEQVELTEPMEALREARAEVKVISPQSTEIQGMNHDQMGDRLKVDAALSSVKPEQFDAIVLPGGVANPDRLRMIPEAVAFVRHFVQTDKPMAVICHGSWTLLEAGGAKGKTLTSWPSLRTDLRNAGANWVDQEVVVDGRLVTSRKPDDLPAFNREMLQLFERSEHKAAA